MITRQYKLAQRFDPLWWLLSQVRKLIQFSERIIIIITVNRGCASNDCQSMLWMVIGNLALLTFQWTEERDRTSMSTTKYWNPWMRTSTKRSKRTTTFTGCAQVTGGWSSSSSLAVANHFPIRDSLPYNWIESLYKVIEILASSFKFVTSSSGGKMIIRIFLYDDEYRWRNYWWW